jgi:hypothetical protein
MRIRMNNPYLESADLRSEYGSLWTEFEGTGAYVAHQDRTRRGRADQSRRSDGRTVLSEEEEFEPDLEQPQKVSDLYGKRSLISPPSDGCAARGAAVSNSEAADLRAAPASQEAAGRGRQKDGKARQFTVAPRRSQTTPARYVPGQSRIGLATGRKTARRT